MATNDSTTTHRIEGTDNLLMQTIRDQASDLEHSWREAIQNGLDAPASTRVELDYDEDHTVVTDNGDGVDLDEEYGIDLLTNLGESTKDADDDETIGQFGIGKGQIIAKAITLMLSGDTALLFDIEDRGLEVTEFHVSNLDGELRDLGYRDMAHYVSQQFGHLTNDVELDGLTVIMDHYDDQVPNYSHKWNSFEDRITNRFKFAELATATKIYVNGDRISDAEVDLSTKQYSHFEEFDIELADGTTDRAYIGVAHGAYDDLDVYSNGVYVTDIDGRGLCGTIVTEGNLDLNFARNEIKSGCQKFAAIEKRLDAIRLDLFDSVSDRRLNSDARAFVVDRIVEHDERDRWSDLDVFKSVSDSYVSLDEINSRKEVGRSRPGDTASEKLEEGLGMIVLDETDDATSRLLATIDAEDATADTDDEDAGNGGLMETDTVDAAEKAEDIGMHTTYERYAPDELRPKQREKLNVARILADRLGTALDDEREIYFGESDIAKSWTDGNEYIVITADSTSSNSWVEYSPELFRQLVHEFAHTSSSKPEDANHGWSFNEDYRDTMDDHFDILTNVLGEIRADGVETVARNAPKY